MRMVSLDWDVDPQDWAKPGAAAISRRVLANARAGSVILMHDGGGDRSGTLGACPKIISTMKRKFGVVLLQ
jgi:peptidoglycan/xylan/chitin deacetylase (PgdA/CDA1 family)